MTDQDFINMILETRSKALARSSQLPNTESEQTKQTDDKTPASLLTIEELQQDSSQMDVS
ncbi:MAG: hypothetical protein KME43_07500 [Myxacorys chilensis ATA2-1-KO14]|jgi:hypothetical protein|nr:hypothetical protein [Myxacorys chilensis ATA2-1-KO14]